MVTLVGGGDSYDAATWADDFGLSFPVLADWDWEQGRWDRDGETPTQVLLAPGMVQVLVDEPATDDDLEAALTR